MGIMQVLEVNWKISYRFFIIGSLLLYHEALAQSGCESLSPALLRQVQQPCRFSQHAHYEKL